MPSVKNWKTTAAGLILAASIFAHTSGLQFPDSVTKTINGLMAVSAAFLGASAKDSDVTGDPPREVKADDK